MKNTQWQYLLNSIFILVLGAVLLGAFGYQIIKSEPPCPLCLLQRLGMVGIMVGCMLNLRFGINMSHYGLVLLSACFGGTVSLRQIGLHVCPQFETFGEPVLGLDLYAWALVVFACSDLATSLLLYMFGIDKDPNKSKPQKGLLIQLTLFYAIFITTAEVITTFNLCGFSACQG